MRPIQMALLVGVGVLGGALLMKMGSKSPEQPAPTPIVSAPISTPAAPAAPTPVEPLLPESPKSPAAERAPERKPSAVRKPRPREIAQAQPASPSAQPPAAAPKETTPTAPPAPAAPNAPTETSSTPYWPKPVAPKMPPPPPRKVTIAAGTLIPVRLIDGLSSDRNQPGDTFNGTLTEPLVVEGLAIAERGAKVQGKVVQSQRAGRVSGVSDLAIELTQLRSSDGQQVHIQTETFEKHGEKSLGSDAAKVGAAAGIGAAIGAIAGGGKGAGIGAAIGGAAGTGGVLATRGKAVTLPSETRISFKLRNSVTIMERQER